MVRDFPQENNLLQDIELFYMAQGSGSKINHITPQKAMMNSDLESKKGLLNDDSPSTISELCSVMQ